MRIIDGMSLTWPQYKFLRLLLAELEEGEQISTTLRFERERDKRLAVAEERVLMSLHTKQLVEFDDHEFWLTDKGVELVKAIAQEVTAV